MNKDPKFKKTTSDKRQNTTFQVLRNVCGAVQTNDIRRWRGPPTDLSGNEVRNGENKENESPPGISPNLKLLQPKQKKVEGQPSKEKILHSSEHPRRCMSKEDYFADICLIPRRRRTQHRSGCNLIPAVHRKVRLSMKQSTQLTMTERAVQNEQGSGLISSVYSFLEGSSGIVAADRRIGFYFEPSVLLFQQYQWQLQS